MYEGYVGFDGGEIVNSHRAYAYARAAGIGGVSECSACSSIEVALGDSYRTPMLDTAKPPWWDGSVDAANFLGLIGLSVEGADDSTREIAVNKAATTGAYLGVLNFKERSITVRALAIAASDCALGFGLNWLRSIDSDESCATGAIEMYDCCPHVAQADCDDPNCVGACIDKRLRFFHNARLSAGPTVLRRTELSTMGAIAEVEFVLTAGDPFIYSSAGLMEMSVPESHPLDDETLVPDPRVDRFALPMLFTPPPSTVRVSTIPPRARWERQEVVIPRSEFGVRAAPIIVIEADSDVPDIRIVLAGRTRRWVYRMEDFPAGGRLTMNFREHSVTTEYDGFVTTNGGYLHDYEGGPPRWPKWLDNDDYTVWVDREPSSEPLHVSASSAGLVSA